MVIDVNDRLWGDHEHDLKGISAYNWKKKKLLSSPKIAERHSIDFILKLPNRNFFLQIKKYSLLFVFTKRNGIPFYAMRKTIRWTWKYRGNKNVMILRAPLGQSLSFRKIQWLHERIKWETARQLIKSRTSQWSEKTCWSIMRWGGIAQRKKKFCSPQMP